MADTVLLPIEDNQGYSPDQIATEVTLADLLESIQLAIEEHGEDAKVVLDNGQRYGASFGRFRAHRGMVEITDADATTEGLDHEW